MSTFSEYVEKLTHVGIYGAGKSKDGGHYLVVKWSATDMGYGELTVVMKKDGELEVQTECMGKEFAKAVLCKMIDLATKTE